MIIVIVVIIIIIIRKIIRKEAEKTRKYGPLRYELKQQFKGYKVEQFNIIMGVLGGYQEGGRVSIVFPYSPTVNSSLPV